MVGETDDAGPQARAIVRLDGRRIEQRHSPAIGNQVSDALVGRRRREETGLLDQFEARMRFEYGRKARVPLGEHRFQGLIELCRFLRVRLARRRITRGGEDDQHRHRPLGVGRKRQQHPHVDFDRRVALVVEVTDDLPGDDRTERNELRIGRSDAPGDLRRVRGHAPVDLALKTLDDLGPPLLPPLTGSRHLLAVVRSHEVGPDRPRVGQPLIGVSVIGIGIIAARPGPQRADPKLVHHVPMVLLGCPGAFVRSNLAQSGRRCHRRCQCRAQTEPFYVRHHHALLHNNWGNATIPSLEATAGKSLEGVGAPHLPRRRRRFTSPATLAAP